MKKILTVLMVTVILVSFSGCNKAVIGTNEKIQIVTTVFPMYDFARNVAGDKAEVTLILPSGADVHTYEPTAMDIVKIQGCDLFIRLGKDAEPWTESIVKENEGGIVSAMDCVELEKNDHNHEHNNFEYDQHIWTSLRKSKEIVIKIAEALKSVDGENREYYTENASEYIKKLEELDSKFTALTENCLKPFVFADRFPFKYFAEDYNLEYFAAFPGCSDESEPSAATVAKLMDNVKNNGIEFVFYTETSNGKLPDAVCEETGAEKMLLHSCHTLTNAEIEAGKDYISLMEDNYNAIKEYLN